jgi:hypothetical protein
VKFGNVGAGRQVDAKFTLAARFVIVLRDALANFAGGYANHRILIRIVAGVSPENFHAEGSFLQVTFVPFTAQRVLDDVTQQIRISLAVFEGRVTQYAFKLLLNGFALRVARGHQPRFGMRYELIQHSRSRPPHASVRKSLHHGCGRVNRKTPLTTV